MSTQPEHNYKDYDQFEAKYKPHMIAPGLVREYYWHNAEDWEEIKKADPRCVWTMVEGDEEVCDPDDPEYSSNPWIVINGFHYVNRIFYILTEVPWTDDEEYLYQS